MDDLTPLKPDLERLADRLVPASDAMDRLRDRRHRKVIRQRIVAGSMAGVLALGATAAVWVAFRGTGDAPPVTTYAPPRVPTVWPEAGLEGQETVQVVQYRADNQDPEVTWRLHPDQVVHGFVASVLGWSNPTVREMEPGAGGAFRWYMVTQPTCPAGVIGCAFVLPGNGPTLRIGITQPATQGEGGIWSVATVRSSGLRLAATAGDAPPTSIVHGSAGKGVSLHTLAGARWYDGCRTGHVIVDGVDRPSRFEISLPDPAATAASGCGPIAAGYAFAYALPADTMPVGDPLLESASLTDLTIVPIRVQVAGEAAPTGGTDSFADPLGWRVDYPADWTVTPIATQDRVSVTGAAFSNVSPGVASPTSATPSPVGLDPDQMTPDAVEVVITHREGGPMPDLTTDDTRFPVTLDGLGCPLANTLQCGVSVRGNGLDFSIEVRRGADASPGDIAAAEAIVASMRLPALHLGELTRGWISLGKPSLYPEGKGSPALAGRLGVVYVMRGPKGAYALDLTPDSCGEGENQTWDPTTLQIWIQCPAYLGTGDVRYDRFGRPDPSNAPKFQTPLQAYPVITAWDGRLLVYVDGSMGGLPQAFWP